MVFESFSRCSKNTLEIFTLIKDANCCSMVRDWMTENQGRARNAADS